MYSSTSDQYHQDPDCRVPCSGCHTKDLGTPIFLLTFPYAEPRIFPRVYCATCTKEIKAQLLALDLAMEHRAQKEHSQNGKPGTD